MLLNVDPDGYRTSHVKPPLRVRVVHIADSHMGYLSDSFDVPSFFQLHDLDSYVFSTQPLIFSEPQTSGSDGFWDRGEIESIYGVHHVYAQKKSKDSVEHQEKADQIVKAILERLDQDKDDKVSLAELEAIGLEGLPSFESLGAEGHHYDVESGPCHLESTVNFLVSLIRACSEFFLHHEGLASFPCTK
jgi:hypothetical protein